VAEASAKGREIMKYVKMIIALLGLLMVLMGCLWIGQGLNLIQWPAESFMIGVPKWSWNGLFLALAGAALVWWSRRP
jgi:uncharacterized membrane protein